MINKNKTLKNNIFEVSDTIFFIIASIVYFGMAYMYYFLMFKIK